MVKYVMSVTARTGGLVGFLASGASAYLTSQTIVIDGGYTAV
jgi:NAD(P)-dependent dehydrogenase (short-subunit alcohol dehydrogenase family)